MITTIATVKKVGSTRVQRMAWATAVAVASFSASTLEAAVVWHESVAAAKVAAAASRRPVLVIFTASWSAASDRFVQSTLVTPEASAIVANCFEPVKLDVDANAELAKRVGVSHLPTACVIGQDDTILSRFDCPESSAEFVSEAARAIQRAAQAQTATSAVASATPPASAVSATASRPTSSAFSTPEPAAAPRLPASPPAWSAEPASKPLDATPSDRLSAFSSGSSVAHPEVKAAAGRPVVEPQPAAPSPWLSQQAQPPLPGATTTQPPTYPATPYAAVPYAAVPSPTTPPAASPYPATPYPTTPAQTMAVPAVPPAPPAAEEKPKDSNPFVAFFKNPASAFAWSSSKPKDEAIAKPSAGATPQQAEPRVPLIASQIPSAAAPVAADVYGSMPVGMEGYCPVTLVEKSTWVEGRPQWGVRHRGRTYLFAGPAEQQAFLTSPDRYAPALSGDDPVLALDSGRQVPGQRRYGVTYQSRIYLFSSPETRTAFTAAPDRYTSRVMLAENPQAVSGNVLR